VELSLRRKGNGRGDPLQARVGGPEWRGATGRGVALGARNRQNHLVLNEEVQVSGVTCHKLFRTEVLVGGSVVRLPGRPPIGHKAAYDKKRICERKSRESGLKKGREAETWSTCGGGTSKGEGEGGRHWPLATW